MDSAKPDFLRVNGRERDSALGTAEKNNVQSIRLGGEAHILAAVRPVLFFAERGATNIASWSLAINSPRAGTIDCFAVDLEPFPNFKEEGHTLIRECAVHLGANVE